jgi:hypothetical protein
MEADDFGPFQATVDAALSPPAPGRPSIGIIPAASTPDASAPANSAPPESGGKSRTAYIISTRRDIEELRAAGASVDAARMEAALERYIDGSVGDSGASRTGLTASDARGRSSPPPAARVVPENVAMSTKQDILDMRRSYEQLVANDLDIKALSKKLLPEPSQHGAIIAAVDLLMTRVRNVRPYGDRVASLIYRVMPNLDSTPCVAADACVDYDVVTSWRQAGELLERHVRAAPYRSAECLSDRFKGHVHSLRAAYNAVVQAESGCTPDLAFDRLLIGTFQGFLANQWVNVSPPVAGAPNFVALIVQLLSSVRFGDDQLYEQMCRQLEEPVRVIVPAASTTPVHDFLRVTAALLDTRMEQYERLHSAIAVRQLGLILKEVPHGTESYLDNALSTAVQQLRQVVRKSDGSYSEVRALLSEHVERHSGLDYSGALTYNYTKKSGRSSSDSTAFVA